MNAARGFRLAAALLLLAVLLFATLSGSALFLSLLVLYFLTTFAYSLFLRRELIMDVLTLAGLYTMRILGGGLVAGITLSPWLPGFSTAHRGRMTDDPIVFAATDPVSQVVMLLAAGIVALATFIWQEMQ